MSDWRSQRPLRCISAVYSLALSPVHHRPLVASGMFHRPGHRRNGMRMQHWERQ
jgi:hypothetical protein